jgi:D-alanyl-D-alanine carboxypeptidase
MIQRVRASGFALLALAACAQPATQTPAATTQAPWEMATATAKPIDPAEIDALIRQTVADEHMVGLSVGIAQNGKVVFARGYGKANLATGDSVTPETMFAVGSVTKQFTCSTVLLLAEAGQLSMSDKVAKYYPNLTRASDISLQQLGGMVSGYRDYYPLDFLNTEMQKATPTDSIIAEYATRPLDFEPDSRWSYSNTNFLILGQVASKVGGKPIGELIKEKILDPVGLGHTRFAPDRSEAGLATGYTSFALGAPIPAEPEADGWVGSAGAIWSTPTDLLTWDLALSEGKVLSPASYQVMATARRLTDGRSTGYGCGQGVGDRGDAVVLSHGGAVAGFVAQNAIVPATRSALVLLANTDFGTIGALRNALIQKLLPQVDVPVVQGAAPLEVAKAFLDRLARGEIDRSALSTDFDAYMTPDQLAAAKASLGALGRITDITVGPSRERGGMEVTPVRFKVGSTPAQALMYRTPDGKIQEFLISRA